MWRRLSVDRDGSRITCSLSPRHESRCFEGAPQTIERPGSFGSIWTRTCAWLLGFWLSHQQLEIRRRTDEVGIFPDCAALAEQHDEWIQGRHPLWFAPYGFDRLTRPARPWPSSSPLNPGIYMQAGLLNDFQFPACGCDACDSTWAAEASELEQLVQAPQGVAACCERPGACLSLRVP